MSEPESTHVEAVVIATGRKQTIPRKWLDHPVLGAPFTLPPSTRNQGDEPAISWTKDQLLAHAAAHDVDTTDTSTKAEIFDAITHHPSSDPAPGPEETPAAGDKKE